MPDQAHDRRTCLCQLAAVEWHHSLMTDIRQAMNRLLKLPDVETAVSLKKSKIYALISEGSFPAPVKVGRSSSWLQTEVENWIEQRANQRTIATVGIRQL